MTDSDERIKQFLVFAYQVLNAHQAEVSQMCVKLEAMESYLMSSGHGFRENYPQEVRRIEHREQLHPAPGTLSTADSIAAMLKAIPAL
jgi:hypothetical protein